MFLGGQSGGGFGRGETTKPHKLEAYVALGMLLISWLFFCMAKSLGSEEAKKVRQCWFLEFGVTVFVEEERWNRDTNCNSKDNTDTTHASVEEDVNALREKGIIGVLNYIH